MILKRSIRQPISAFYEGLKDIDLDENWLINELKLVRNNGDADRRIYNYRMTITHKKTGSKTAITDVSIDNSMRHQPSRIFGRSKKYSYSVDLPSITTDMICALRHAVKNPLFVASLYAMELNIMDRKQKRAIKEKFGEIFHEKLGGAINDNLPY